MLSAQVYHQDKSGPWLVWLHGLLGSADDWLSIVKQFDDYPSLCVDLPGHGSSQWVDCQSFCHFDNLLNELLEKNNIEQYYLIGYSLGARLAMHFACTHRHNGLKGLIIEGGNVGLQDDPARVARRQNDHLWAERFRHEPMKNVLNDWYHQPVFADLTASQREQLVALRCLNNPQKIANMLENTSLAKQPFLAEKLHNLTVPYCYFCGDRDQKFRSVSQQYVLPLTLIENAGHNAHRENPKGYTSALHHFLSHCG